MMKKILVLFALALSAAASADEIAPRNSFPAPCTTKVSSWKVSETTYTTRGEIFLWSFSQSGAPKENLIAETRYYESADWNADKREAAIVLEAKLTELRGAGVCR
jgi:hypothetical protein